MDESVLGAADEARGGLDVDVEVDDRGRHNARRLVDGLTIHLTLRGQGVYCRRLLSAEHCHLLTKIQVYYKRQNAGVSLKLANDLADCSESGTVGKLLTSHGSLGGWGLTKYFALPKNKAQKFLRVYR